MKEEKRVDVQKIEDINFLLDDFIFFEKVTIIKNWLVKLHKDYEIEGNILEDVIILNLIVVKIINFVVVNGLVIFSNELKEL